jgi:hypothetical protein
VLPPKVSKDQLPCKGDIDLLCYSSRSYALHEVLHMVIDYSYIGTNFFMNGDGRKRQSKINQQQY